MQGLEGYRLKEIQPRSYQKSSHYLLRIRSIELVRQAKNKDLNIKILRRSKNA
nr:MAG TPA: hypothetical protein [Caudoviricetes sp.]